MQRKMRARKRTKTEDEMDFRCQFDTLLLVNSVLKSARCHVCLHVVLAKSAN